jgi:hypothetical protein
MEELEFHKKLLWQLQLLTSLAPGPVEYFMFLQFRQILPYDMKPAAKLQLID